MEYSKSSSKRAVYTNTILSQETRKISNKQPNITAKAYNAGDTSSIPGSGRSPGEGIGYPLQYSRASLVAQTAKNLPAMWKTWVQSLGWEDPLEEGMTTLSSISW